MAAQTKTFEDAKKGFQDYLLSAGWYGELRWIVREDVTVYNGRYVLRPRPRDAWEPIYAKVYEDALKCRNGVRFEAPFATADESCCFVWYPTSKKEASSLMFTPSLHYARASALFTAEIARNSIVFAFLKTRYRMSREKRLPGTLPSSASPLLARKAQSRP